VTLPGAIERGRTLAGWLSGGVRRVAIAWAALTFVALVALGGEPGVSRDEAAVLAASDPALAAGAAPEPAPPLAPALTAASRAILAPLGVPSLRGARAATAVGGALLSAATVALAWDVAGPAAALLAPALFWAAPRHLHAGLVAGPDVLLAALALTLVLAWRRAFSEKEPRRRLRAAILAGALLGAALATRADGWVLGLVLALEVGLARALRLPAPAGAEPRAARMALVALAVAGPLLLVAAWPALLGSPAVRAAAIGLPSRGAAAFALGGPAANGFLSAVFPLTVVGLTVPAALLLVLAAGPVHGAVRLGRALRAGPREEARPDLQLLLLSLAPLVAAAAGIAPRVGGVRPFLHALPFVAILGARALVHAARAAWPARAAPLAASLALLALWPALRTTVHFFPSGSAAWNELAGGAPGAASAGLPRQEGGEAAARLVEIVVERARPGARVYWPTSSPAAVRALARDGRLRADLALASAPEEADVAIVTLDGAGRDGEYRAWSAFRTSRPVSGVYVDEVPLGFVYAAPGAWR
jgi:hypothetical protein